jgi:hypothetical protein
MVWVPRCTMAVSLYRGCGIDAPIEPRPLPQVQTITIPKRDSVAERTSGSGASRSLRALTALRETPLLPYSTYTLVEKWSSCAIWDHK